MTGSDSSGENPANPKKSVQPGSREARLAAALRENLRRRKVQERGREKGGESGGERVAASADGPQPAEGAAMDRQNGEIA
ncbi:MAG: hypothetical protein GC182_24305 [Rhodopseudomonas sp.]|nr:hypothetical protein [Rhodopseudomonas sp.]